MKDVYLEKALNKGEQIYGVSSKYGFGRWEHLGVYSFEDKERAEKWLDTCEYDFRERELMTKAKAIRIVGQNMVNEATPSWMLDEYTFENRMKVGY